MHRTTGKQRRQQQQPQYTAANTVDGSNERPEVSLTRRRLLDQSIVYGVALAAGLGLDQWMIGPARADAASANTGVEGGVEEYSSPDRSFALRYPAAFKEFSKPLKTHKMEVRGCCLQELLDCWTL